MVKLTGLGQTPVDSTMADRKADVVREGEKYRANNDSQDDERNIKNEPRFFYKVKHDPEFQRKFTLSVFVCWALMIQGCSKGQMGPSILDLLYISGATLEEGSAFMTSYNVGRLTGSIITGILYHKVNKLLIFGFATTTCGVMAAVIPWCYQLAWMIFAHFLYGVAYGLLDVAITSESLMLWGPTSRYFVHISRFCYSVVTVIFPVITAQFLLKEDSRYPRVNITTGYTMNVTHAHWSGWNESLDDEVMLNLANESYAYNSTMESPIYRESRVYIAFSISSALAFSASLPFYVLFCKMNHERKFLSETKKDSKKMKLNFYYPVSKWKKYGLMLNSGIYAAVETSADSLFPNFLTAFCVNFLQWQKDDASYLTSVYFFSKLVGRFLGIFLLKFCKSNMKILGTCVSNCILAIIALTVCASLESSLGIWVFTVHFGLSMAIGFSTFLCWTNEIVLPVSGHVSSYFMVTSFIGTVISPVAMSVLMEQMTYLWFSYYIAILCAVMLFTYVVMLIYTRSVQKLKRKEEVVDVKELDQLADAENVVIDNI